MKKGFTLIELLAVIVILAIIALIASPVIIGLIDDSRKEAFKISANGLIRAGEILYSNDMLSATNEEVIFTYTDGVETSSISGKKLEYKGTKPNSGTVIINDKGEVAILINNGTLCAEKGYNESEVRITNKSKEECKIATEMLGSSFECNDILYDLRDLQQYATVEIGSQCWMAEDLRYDCSKEGYNNVGGTNSWSGTDNCANQGSGYTGLSYQWAVAMKGSITEGAQGLCPDGWHIPTETEWTTLTNYVSTNPGTKLKAKPAIWDGTDNYEFNAQPAGGRGTDGAIYNVGAYGYWWTSSPSGTSAWHRYMNSGNTGVSNNMISRAYGRSVRCSLGQ